MLPIETIDVIYDKMRFSSDSKAFVITSGRSKDERYDVMIYKMEDD